MMNYIIIAIFIISISKLLGNYNCGCGVTVAVFIISISKLLGNYNSDSILIC